VRSAPFGTPRTASRIRGLGRRRRAGARLLPAGDNTFEGGLGIIHYRRLGDLLPVVCEEGGRVDTSRVNPILIISPNLTPTLTLCISYRSAYPSPVAYSNFDPTSHADFGAATHPGVGGGTHRRRATVERC